MILVTGATGKVGRELVRELRSAGAPFRIGCRSPEKVEGSEAVLFDFDRPETFETALRGVQRLFLLTPAGTAREAAAVDAAGSAGVGHLVKMSVWGAEEDAFRIGRAHREIERRIEVSGIAWTHLRPNGFMQNFSTDKAGGIQTQGVIADSTGDAPYSVVDARDVAAVAAKALTAGGQEGRIYKLSGPEALSQPEMAAKISRAAGKDVRYVDVSDADYRRALIELGMSEADAGDLVELNVYCRSGTSAAVTPDVEEALGRKPGSFDRFARDNAAVWR